MATKIPLQLECENLVEGIDEAAAKIDYFAGKAKSSKARVSAECQLWLSCRSEQSTPPRRGAGKGQQSANFPY